MLLFLGGGIFAWWPRGGKSFSARTGLPPVAVAPTAIATPGTDPALCDPALGTGGTAEQKLAALNARRDALAKVRAFTDWLTEWRRADADAQPALAAVGQTLALERRAALKYLIQTDPQRALELAVPVGLRTELPAEIQAQLEARLDARGDLEVSIACLGTETRTIRSATIDGQRYEAFVFGRRETQGMKNGLPLHGIALDGVAALDEAPYRVLDDGEKTTRSLPLEQPAVLVGGKIVSLATSAELTALEQSLIAAESSPGPALVSLGDTGDPQQRFPGIAAVTKDSAWITGDKRVLWLKLEFADDPGEAVSDATLATTSADVNTFYQGTSNGRTSMTFTTVPALLRVRDKAYYNTSGSTTGDLRNDALAAAKAYDAANGGTGAYDPEKFDRWIMVFKRVASYTFGGLGNLGGPTVWLNNGAAASTTSHELGHNQSLDHSHAWLPSGTSPIGPGTHVEYGDVFDRMGSSGSSANNFFNVAQKFKLGYLDTASVTTVAAAGTYRLTRHDHKDAVGVRALRVGASNVEYHYWIEHRRLGPTALTTQQLDRVQNGVILHWGPQKLPNFVTGVGSYLLDLTPGTAGGTNDAPLRIGESFTDPNAGITIKPLAVGGTAPNEYIDVQVSFGATDGNRNPVLIADAPAGAFNARTNLTVSASATDPDGDPVYYRWDFGDKKFQPNLNTVTTRYAKGGSYPVTVSAHDGKGGIAVKNYTLNVNDPLLAWTRRGTGVTTNTLNDVIFAGSRFVAVGASGTVLTSPDAVTWTVRTSGVTANIAAVAHSGTRYVAAVQTTAPSIIYSDDSVTWQTAAMPAGTGLVRALAYGLGKFIAVGDTGRTYSSTDGTSWSETKTSVTTTLQAIAFADGRFVITGASGRIFTSDNGVSWTNVSVATTNTLGAVTRNSNGWVASSATVECYKSADGLTWARVAATGRTNTVSRLISTSGVLFSPTANGSIAFGEDPSTWSVFQIDATAATTLTGAADGAGTLVVVGSRGLIYTANVTTEISPPLAAPSMRLEGDSLKLSVGRKNLIAAGGTGYTKLELYANGTKVSEISGQSGVFAWTPSAIGNYALTIRGINAAGASAMSASYPAQAALSNWNWRNPSPFGSDLNGAVRVDGKWWIVGNTGNFVTLDDAGNFNPVDFATTQNLTGIGYANGRFVVTAPYTDAGSREPIGDPWTSTDGFAWTALYSSTIEAISLNQVFNFGGQWIAPGGGTVLTSADGLSWTRQISPVTNALLGAAYGNNLYVVVGTGGKIISSPNGVTWTERTSGVTTDLRKVAFNNGTFVAAGLSGAILSSTDGVTWTKRTSGVTLNLYGAGVIKGSFVVAGDSGTVLTSTDAVTWTQATVENRTTNFLFATGADNEGLLLGRAGEVYTATSATNYKRVSAGTSDNRTAVIFAGGKFVAVGQAIDPLARSAVLAPVMVSTDGATWTRATANSGFTNLNDIAYGQSRYVAVGDTNGFFTSPDALTWTKGTSPSTSSFTCVAASPSVFVAGNNGSAIYSSADGLTWSQRTTGLSGPCRGAAYGNGRFVVVGDNGSINTSPNGTAWTAATSGTTANLLNISWFDDIGFLAAGASGTMLGSADGLTWRTIATGITDTINSIAKTPVGYLAPAGTAGTMLLSLDGTNWSIGTIPLDRAVRGLAANATTIVAVGDAGATLTFDLADPTPAPTITAQPVAQALLPGSPVRLTVTAQNSSGGAYQWFKDGTPIVGANGPTYTTTAAGSNFGSYTVAIATPTGTVTSAAARLSVATAANPGRLINLSLLTSLDTATDNFTMGTVIGGSGTTGPKPVLIRAAGPALGALGVDGTLGDPNLEFFSGSTKIGENDNWNGVATLSNAFAAVGAFPYAAENSKDAAIFNPAIAPGGYSIRVTGNGGTTGTVIAELYDSTPGNAFTSSTPRLINVSVLKQIGAGFTVGFVIGGGTPRTVLVRAVGPGLAAVGVASGFVADPRLTFFAGSTKINENDDWGGTTALTSAMTSVGAFAIPANSRDAALLATLQPGLYSVQISAPAGANGLVIAEVYEVP